jgi:hypothetical protein
VLRYGILVFGGEDEKDRVKEIDFESEVVNLGNRQEPIF